jgi:hypothetical protein
MEFWTSSGRIGLRMTRAQAASACHPGPCDDDVAALARVPAIRRQLAKIDQAMLAEELREYGAWDETERADHEQNLQRIVWLAACEICENHRR